MVRQPMGGGGLNVDMVTGLPHPQSREAKQAEVKNRYQETVREAVGLAAELQNSPALRVLFEQARDRALIVLSKDETFMALSKTMGALRYKLEVAPLLAEQELIRIMGPQLASFIEEAQAAPGGIPVE